ncbi:hypothetical protein IWW34DRAFT_860023 [Fusarium oxysporum f. sp. albedinis]|nr:hypothetical protein IWW34DRAFT_860023 [Fusarium oxysporum f. sp. albedinis]
MAPTQHRNHFTRCRLTYQRELSSVKAIRDLSPWPTGAHSKTRVSRAEHHEARYPGVVVEVALTQDAKELRRIARRYIYYTGGQIKVVLGIDLNEDKESTISVWKPTFSSAQNGDGVGMDIEQVVQPQPFRDAKKNPEVPEPSIRVVNKRRYSESPEDLMTEEDEKRYSDDADDANDKEDHDDGAYKPPKNLENMTFEPHKKRDQGASRGDCS